MHELVLHGPRVGTAIRLKSQAAACDCFSTRHTNSRIQRYHCAHFQTMLNAELGQAKQVEAAPSGVPPDVQEQALRDMVAKATENVNDRAPPCPPGINLYPRSYLRHAVHDDQ
jgi:hypothetical protein